MTILIITGSKTFPNNMIKKKEAEELINIATGVSESEQAYQIIGKDHILTIYYGINLVLCFLATFFVRNTVF